MNKVIGRTVNGVVFVRGTLNNVNAMAFELESLGYDFNVKVAPNGIRAQYTDAGGAVLASVFEMHNHSAHIRADVWDAIVAQKAKAI